MGGISHCFHPQCFSPVWVVWCFLSMTLSEGCATLFTIIWVVSAFEGERANSRLFHVLCIHRPSFRLSLFMCMKVTRLSLHLHEGDHTVYIHRASQLFDVLSGKNCKWFIPLFTFVRFLSNMSTFMWVKMNRNREGFPQSWQSCFSLVWIDPTVGRELDVPHWLHCSWG